MKILGIIPARYASTRFPAKALADIGGKPMIQRVYEQASKSTSLDRVVVATDHLEIKMCVEAFGGSAKMTRADHESGTDRCREVIADYESYDYAINIQGDEPFIDPSQIDLLASLFDGTTELATLVKQIDNLDDLDDPNVVKCAFGDNMEALYFSRSTVPYLRGVDHKDWLEKQMHFKHIGIYGYRLDILRKIAGLPQGKLEKAESLEQLRWLENGYKIKVAETHVQSIGIDTPADLEKIKDFL